MDTCSMTDVMDARPHMLSYERNACLGKNSVIEDVLDSHLGKGFSFTVYKERRRRIAYWFACNMISKTNIIL